MRKTFWSFRTLHMQPNTENWWKHLEHSEAYAGR